MTDVPVTIRDATKGDASILAKLLLEAGEGLYEFLFSDLEPGKTARDVLTAIIATPGHPLSWPHFHVALLPNADTGCDVVVGMIHAFPGEQMPRLIPDRIPADRIAHIAPLLTHIVDPQALMVNALAVKPSQRNAGIGVKLIAESIGMAGAAGRQRLIARVWENNARALRLYENFGFKIIDRVHLAPHNRLSGRSSIFLERRL